MRSHAGTPSLQEALEELLRNRHPSDVVEKRDAVTELVGQLFASPSLGDGKVLRQDFKSLCKIFTKWAGQEVSESDASEWFQAADPHKAGNISKAAFTQVSTASFFPTTLQSVRLAFLNSGTRVGYRVMKLSKKSGEPPNTITWVVLGVSVLKTNKCHVCTPKLQPKVNYSRGSFTGYMAVF